MTEITFTIYQMNTIREKSLFSHDASRTIYRQNAAIAAWAVLREVWKQILGHSLEEHDGKIDPSEYSIPASQVLQIFSWIDTEVRSEFAMEWVNVGPKQH